MIRRRNLPQAPPLEHTIHLSQIQLDSPPLTNLKSGTVTTYSQCLFLPTGTSDPTTPTPQEGAIYYKTDTDVLRKYDGSSWSSVGTGAGNDLDGAYDQGGSGVGRAITVDNGAVDLNSNQASANALEIAEANAAGTGSLIDLSHARAASKDIDGTGSLWSVTAAGAMSVASLTSTAGISGTTITGVGAASLTGGAVTMGADGAGYDVTIYPSSSGAYWLFDVSEDTLVFENTHLHLNDSDVILLGAGAAAAGDYEFFSDGTDVILRRIATAAGNEAFKIGDATGAKDLDMIWYSGTAGAEVTCDSSANLVIVDGVDIRMNDGDFLKFGDDSDFTVDSSTADNLNIIAGAATGAVINVGSNAGNEVDIKWFSTTTGNYALFDCDAESLHCVDVWLNLDESGTGVTTIDVDSAATSVSVAEIAGSGVIASTKAVLSLVGSGAIASGGNILRVASTGTPASGAIAVQVTAAGDDIEGLNVDTDCDSNANTFNCGGDLASGASAFVITKDGSNTNKDSRVLSIVSALDMLGIVADVDGATWDVYSFNSGGDLATGKSVMKVTADGTTPHAASSLLRLEVAGDMYGLYIDTDGVTNHSNYINTSAALAAGKAALFITADGTPNQGALLRVDAAKNCFGVYSDVDATTLDCNLFNTSAVTASGKAIVKIAADAGTPDAASHALYVDWSSATLSANPVAVNIKSAGTGAQLRLETTDTGAAGVQIQGYHTSTGAAAAGHAVFTIDGYGLDAGDASTLYAKMEMEIMTATAGQEDGRIILSAAADDSTLTQMAQFSPRAGGALAQCVLGASGTNAYLTTLSTGDLIIDTNEGTNAGNITLVDGANGDITITTNGTGSCVIADLAIRRQVRVIAAGTASDSPDTTDAVLEVSTDGATNCTITLPEASANMGYELIVYFTTDGGFDVVVTTEASDKLILAGASNDTSTMNDARDFIHVIAVEDNAYLVISEQGGVFS